MSNINDLINTLPQIERKVKNGNIDNFTMLTMMQNMVSMMKNVIKDKPASSSIDITPIKEVLQDLKYMIGDNNRPMVIAEVKEAVKSLSEKIQSPIVQVESYREELINLKDAISDAVASIKVPSPKEIDTAPISKALNNMANRIESIAQEISEIDIVMPKEFKVSNMKDMKVNAELGKEAIKFLKNLEKLNTSAKNPLAVRLTDGKKYYEAMAKAMESSMSAVALNSGNESPARSVVSGIKAMTGSAVQLTSTSIKVRWVTVSAIKQPCAVGDSGAVADLSTPSNSRGDILYPGSSPYKIRITDPSLLYADGPSGAAVSYNYYI